LFSPSSPLPLHLVRPSLTPPPPPLSIAISSFFLSFFPLSSGLVVQPPWVRSTLPSRLPLAFFHPLQLRCSRFYGGAQLRFSPSPICRPSFLRNSDAHHQGLPHRPSYPLMPSSPCSSHHMLPRDLYTLVRESHVPVRACYASSCLPRADARSSPANLLLPCPQPLLNELFYCSFYFLCIINFLYFIFFLWAFISLP
jgi:hypothetical protein